MSTAAEDFKTVLEADSAFMTLLGTGRIFVNYMPDGEGVPDDVVVLQDFIGRPTEYVTGKKVRKTFLGCTGKNNQSSTWQIACAGCQ